MMLCCEGNWKVPDSDLTVSRLMFDDYEDVQFVREMLRLEAPHAVDAFEREVARRRGNRPFIRVVPTVRDDPR